MTEKKSGKPSRRRIQVGGEEVDPDKPKEQSFAEVFRLDKPPPPDEEQAGKRTYSEQHLAKFLMGQMTLGDLEGITKQQQYQIAEIGHAYLTSAKLDEAKKVFEGLLALDPFDAYFHMALASIAQQTNDLEEAEKRYTRALEINPFSPTGHANRGEVRVMAGRLEEGAADLVKAVQLDPEMKEPATVRAKATIRVLKEQLGKIDLKRLPGKQASKSEGPPRRQPRARPRAKPVANRPPKKK
jgi:tetratricopeptide (TPR) repeat protein